MSPSSSASSSAATSPDFPSHRSSSLRDIPIDDDIEIIELPSSHESNRPRRQIALSNLRSHTGNPHQSESIPQHLPVHANSEGLAPVNRAFSFGEGLPLSGRLQNGAINSAGVDRVVLQLDNPSRRRLYEDFKRQEVEEHKRKAEAARVTQETKAQELAKKKAESRKFRAQKLADLKNKVGVWLKQLVFLIGLLCVVYCMAEMMRPGIGKSLLEIIHHCRNQMLSHFGSAAVEVPSRGKLNHQMVATSN